MMKMSEDGKALLPFDAAECERCGPDVPVYADELGPEAPWEGDEGGIIPKGTMVVSTHYCGGSLIYRGENA